MSKAAYTLRKLETATYDTRVIARQIVDGRISHDDVAKHLEDLEDSSDNAEEIMVTLADDEDEAAEEGGEETVEEEATEDDGGEA
jgi:hypothetical protein